MLERVSIGRDSRGQSLIETALVTPLLLLLVLNVVNLGYFFWVTTNITGASRSATLYAIQGSATPSATQKLPPSGSPSNVLSVSYLTNQDVTGPLNAPASIQVCSPINLISNSGVNGTGANQKSNCVTCTGTSCGSVGTGSPAPSADPEAPSFVLNRVDVVYTFQPIVRGTIFNLALAASAMCNSGTCTFVRHAEMRAMN